MNRTDLLYHLYAAHDQQLPRSPRGRPKGTLAELNAWHTRLHLDTGLGDAHQDHQSGTPAPAGADRSLRRPPIPNTPTTETNMSTDLPAVPQPDLKVDLNRNLTPAEGAALRAHAMAYEPVEGFARPIPHFLAVLPRMESNEAITDAIAAQLLTAPNPDRMPDGDGTISFQKLVDRTVTVWDLAVMPGDKEGGWAGYLLMDITVAGEEDHLVANTGAKESVMRLAIAWARDELPLTGTVCHKPIKNGAGNKPIIFLAEKDFTDPAGVQQVGAS